LNKNPAARLVPSYALEEKISVPKTYVMKLTLQRTLQIILLGVTLITVGMLSGCSSDPDPAPPTAVEKVRGMLTANGGTWTPAATSGVLVDGTDVTDDLFPGFTITFQASTLTTTGSSPVWLRQDTWSFKDESAGIIIRGQDQREIIIEEISETELKLTLEWPETTSGGRPHSLKGKHEFFLSK